MLEGESDTLQKMQQDALHLAAKALHFLGPESTDIARFIKKDFERTYGHRWQCIIRTDYGSFVTQCHECFIYFGIDSLSVLLFRSDRSSRSSKFVSSLGD